MTIAIALVAALFVWWASTMLILYLDGLPPATFKYSLAGATVIAALCFWGIGATASDTSVCGAYLAFLSGLLLWGWQEMSFYMGFITGPRKTPCPAGSRGWTKFRQAIETSLWHELAIIAAAAVIAAMTWHGANRIGLWTYLILWWMHESAKLNLFLGVRNFNERFLPEHLRFLSSYITRRAMNPLFPVSVAVSTALTVMVGAEAFASDATLFEQAGYGLLTAMMALAIFEHWLLVLPVSADALWTFGLRLGKGAGRSGTTADGVRRCAKPAAGTPTVGVTVDREPIGVAFGGEMGKPELRVAVPA